MVVPFEECSEALVDVVEGADVPKMIKTSLSERPPESFHFATRFRNVGSGVDEANAQARAGRLQYFAAIRRPVVEEQQIGLAMKPKRTCQHVQHVLFALAAVSLQRDDVA